ncbi:hypothetical protein WJX81_008498 [Elliptochloris bilobata]|uniref:SET domain-containing protein n=1 Tax=Elliptochloris bilobata TaxID=381761 RepID=A0AAW1RVQ4_9CHLO
MDIDTRCQEYFAGWPCTLRWSPDKGRYLVASQPLGAGETEVLVGRELYIAGSFINHACVPNCVVERGRECATITTLRALADGEALSINYIDAQLPRAARRDALRANFFFACDCQRCERELAEGSAKCSYVRSQAARRVDGAPKRRGRKARVARQ